MIVGDRFDIFFSSRVYNRYGFPNVIISRFCSAQLASERADVRDFSKVAGEAIRIE